MSKDEGEAATPPLFREPRRVTAYVELTLAGVLWGLGFPLGKIALREVDAAHLMLWRFLAAAIVALPIALATPRARAAFRRPRVLLSGALYGPAFVLQFEGLARTTVALAALLVAAQPVIIAIGARLVFGERLNKRGWLGVVAAAAGAAVIAGRPTGGTVLGNTMVLASLVVFLGWVLLLRTVEHEDAAGVACVSIVAAVVVLLPLTWALHGPPPTALSAGVWAAIAIQGALCTTATTILWQRGLAVIPVASAGVFVNIEPVVGALIGVLAFHDPFGAALVLGALLVMGGSTLTIGANRTA